MDHASAVQAGMVDVSWDPRLVALSYLVAVFASYAALDLAGVVSLVRQGPGRVAWLFFGAVAMGLGIWSMHFTGMLAFDMGVPVSYDVPPGRGLGARGDRRPLRAGSTPPPPPFPRTRRGPWCPCRAVFRPGTR